MRWPLGAGDAPLDDVLDDVLDDALDDALDGLIDERRIRRVIKGMLRIVLNRARPYQRPTSPMAIVRRGALPCRWCVRRIT